MKKSFLFNLSLKWLIAVSLLCFADVKNVFAATDTVHSSVLLETVQPEIEAGDVALFDLHVNFKDSTRSLHEGKLVIKLPEEYELLNTEKELAIGETVPIQSATELTYDFETIESGLSSKITLKVQTKNGTMAKNSVLKVASIFSAKELETPIETNAEVTVQSSAAIGLTTQLGGIVNPRENQVAPWAGDEAIYTFQVNVPKKERGMRYFKEGSMIRYQYELADGISFAQAEEGSKAPTKVEGNKVIWEVPAPTIAEQEKATDSTFEEVIKFRVKFADTLKPFVNFTSYVYVSGTLLDDTFVDSTYMYPLSVMLSADDSTEPPHNYDNILVQPFRGPLDGNWTINPQSSNADPTVFSNAKLAFGLVPTTGHANVWKPEIDLERYSIIYHIDPNLKLDHVISNKPYYKIATAQAVEPFRQPLYDAYVKYQGEEDWHLAIYDVKPKVEYSAEYMGIDENKIVEQLKFEFRLAPSGMYIAGGVNYFTTIRDPNFVGKITNKVEVRLKGKRLHGTNGEVDMLYDENGGYNFLKETEEGVVEPGYVNQNETFRPYTTPRTANVVQPSESNRKIIRSTVSMVDTRMNLIPSTDNKVRVTLNDDSSSIEALTGPFESYVVLPPGVTYNGKGGPTIKVVNDNYQQKNQQLVKVSWAENTIKVDNQISCDIPVDIDTEEALAQVKLTAYSFVADKVFNVPDVADPTLMDTEKLEDTEDFNQNGDTKEALVVTRNSYNLIKNQQVSIFSKIATKSGAKKSKLEIGVNELNQKVTQFMHISPLSDTRLTNLVMMGSLPDEMAGHSLTTNEEKNSEFEVTMSGPLKIPIEWENKVKVYYSKTAYPAVSGVLDKETVYPTSSQKLQNHPLVETSNWVEAAQVTDFKEIKSFKIEKDATVEWVAGKNMVVSCDLQLPKYYPTKDVNTSTAFMNFSIAANSLQATETSFNVLELVRVTPTLPLNPLDPNPEKPVIPINPAPPTEPSEPGTTGPLSIDYASSFDFGERQTSKKMETYNGAAQMIDGKTGKFPNYVQVTDARSVEENAGSGWDLTVTQSNLFSTTIASKKHYLQDVRLQFENANVIPANGNTFDAPDLVESSFYLQPLNETDIVTKKVVASSIDHGYGTWLYRFGNNEKNADESVKIIVPGSVEKYPGQVYSTDLIWSLIDAY